MLLLSVTCLIIASAVGLFSPPIFDQKLGLEVEMTDAERDARSGDEWIQSAIYYLEFLGGKAWRKLHRSGQRSNPTRQHHLSGIRLLSDLRYADAPPCPCKRCAPENARRAAQAEADYREFLSYVNPVRTAPKKPCVRHVPALRASGVIA